MGNNVVVFWQILSPALLKCGAIKINKKLGMEADEEGGVIRLAMRRREAGRGFPTLLLPRQPPATGQGCPPGLLPPPGLWAGSGPWGTTSAWLPHGARQGTMDRTDLSCSTVTADMRVSSPLNLRDLNHLSPGGKLPPNNLSLPQVKVCTWTFTLEQL